MAHKTKAELITEIESLNAIIRTQEKELRRLKAKEDEMNQIISGKYWETTKNERNAGRKPKGNEQIKKDIEKYKQEGMSFREIAEKMGLSVGFVHKTYHMKNFD